jgi:hypothetical protein
MQTKTFSDSAQTFKALQDFAVIVQSGTRFETLKALHALKALPLFANKKGWQSNFSKLESVITSMQPAYSVFALNGNSKLPFVSFSSLPGVTCPGAGDCLVFCYSFRSWRYPASFMRQCQNAFLMRHNQPAIVQALQTVDASFKGQSYDVRLYVDGDFAGANDVEFWFDTIKTTPRANVYGYSKSFEALMSYTGEYPKNYVLNLSSGHNASPELLQAVKALPIVRGEFIAVSIGAKVKSSDHGKPETVKALRQAFNGKAFPCPGTCGTCTGKGHACGMQALKGVPIIIAMH